MDNFIFIIGGALLLGAAALVPKGSREKIKEVFSFDFGLPSENNLDGSAADKILTLEPIQGINSFSGSAPTGPTGSATSGVNQRAFSKAKDLLIKREGRRNVVYRDTRGFPTVGIGHLVLPNDNLKVGDRISDAQVDAFFSQDIKLAFTAALGQAKQLGKQNDEDFIATLTSVNFQLGSAWTNTFYNTWAKLNSGDWRGAISNIQRSKWNAQTPTRTADFIRQIERSFA